MTLKEINVLRKLKSLLSLKINSFEIKAYGSRARGDAEDEYSDLKDIKLSKAAYATKDTLFSALAGGDRIAYLFYHN